MFIFNYLDKEYLIKDNDGSDTKRFYQEIFEEGEYKEVLELGWVNTVVDLGANVGLFSIFISPFAGKVYAVEASSQNAEILKTTVVLNDLTKIEPIHLAIAGSEGERDLYDGVTNGGYSIINSSKVVEKVPTKTLTQFLNEKGIEKVDVLKVDVESAEDEIFSAPDIDESLSKIRFIIAEVHGNSTTFTKKLEESGFTVTSGSKSIIIARRI